MQDEAQEQLYAVYEAIDVDVMPDTLQLRIVETIVQLPEDIAGFAIHNIRWRVFEPTWRGATFLFPSIHPWSRRMRDGSVFLSSVSRPRQWSGTGWSC